MIKNYDKLFSEIVENNINSEIKPKLLLHSCCAPCSTYCIEEALKGFSVTVFYYNPNITDGEEYFKRLAEQKNYLLDVYKGRVKLIDGVYDTEEYYNAVKGLEAEKEGGSRCYKCYTLRLEKTAKLAEKQGFDFFTTTLSISPYKNSEWLNEIGFNLEQKYNIKYLPADFKKRGGYLKSTQISNAYGIYRQDYCGCEFSKKETEEKRNNK